MIVMNLRPVFVSFLLAGAASLAACSGGGGGSAGGGNVGTSVVATATPTPPATGATAPAAATTPPPADARLVFAQGFYANVIAHVGGARELAALPNGDLLVGTTGSSIAIVPNADGAGVAGAPTTFIALSEGPASGIAYGPSGSIYAATNTTIWRIAYTQGDRSESNASAISHVRTGPVSPTTDGDIHTTTSVAASATSVYAGVGSSCNACVETDPTRASVQQMNLDGSNMTRLATRIRNPIALTLNPATGSLWVGGAGQDDLSPYGHPYEYMDSPTLRGSSNVDYGWPACEENHLAYNALHVTPTPNCATTVAPTVEFPAYSTLIGATFYPVNQSGPYAFPASYRGGLFVTSHGSWHCCPASAPRVYFVPMSGDAPLTPVNWSNAAVQGQQIISGFGSSASASGYIGRPTGIAVGPSGSLFVADDATGNILRIRHL